MSDETSAVAEAREVGAREAGTRETGARVEAREVEAREVAAREGGGSGAAAPGALTIEQLAAEVGMSVRNIRNHQSRGLLPHPRCVLVSATTTPSTSLGCA